MAGGRQAIQTAAIFFALPFEQSQSQNTSTQVVWQSTVLASEIMGLPNLQGYLKLPGDDIARIKVAYVSMPDRNPAFT